MAPARVHPHRRRLGAGRMQCGQALDEGDQERTLETVALMAHVGAQAPIGNSHIDR